MIVGMRMIVILKFYTHYVGHIFLRELQSIEENTDLEFPAKIREFILDLKEKNENKEEISNEKEMSIWLKYVALIEEGKKRRKRYLSN